MLRSSLCNYSDASITVTGAETDDATKQLDERNKGLIFENWAPFTDCISEINNTQIDNAKYINIIMPMYTLIENSDNYSKISGFQQQVYYRCSQYYRDDPNDNITDSVSFKS